MMKKTTKKVLINTNYLESLVGDVRERYIQKTAKIQIDPYNLPADAFSDDRTKWPEITYTKDQLKNNKFLDAYKLFQDGWIQEILHKEINRVHLLRAKVTHSMQVKEKPLEPWVIVAIDGSVETAHCTCMAGLGECCNHVAAVLFALETGARICKEATVTDVPAYWMLPPSAKFETPYKRIKDMDFHNESVHSDSEKQAASNISLPTENEVILFWDELHQNLPKAAILSLRVKGKFSENFKPKSLFAEWPIDLSQLCLGSKDASFSDSSYEKVLYKCSATDISTRGQSNSLFWHKYRVGRKTASNSYRVCHTSNSKPSLTVLKQFVATTSWGTKNEQTAKMEYSTLVMSKHVNYKLVDSGLIIHERYPQLGARDGCLEIKCPYSMKEKPILDVPWLQLINNKLTINCKHTYYYQMQMQMFLSDQQYCDFYVWCLHDHHYERVYRDNTLWQSMSIKAMEFHSKCVIPELLCQYFPRRQVISPIAFTGKEQIPISTQSDRKKMIMCKSENCTKVWFHTSCIKLKHVPKGKWYCGECK
ncbi:hypothetical protein ACJMK2_002098 [Sinanodonta woodiana]|uniref:SWIM-type domain-containing protein n=1 Tax=Sinanodonta woodiana TaxID=1069815 RepID=A0ABD3XW17_SINWO